MFGPCLYAFAEQKDLSHPFFTLHLSKIKNVMALQSGKDYWYGSFAKVYILYPATSTGLILVFQMAGLGDVNVYHTLAIERDSSYSLT